MDESRYSSALKKYEESEASYFMILEH